MVSRRFAITFQWDIEVFYWINSHFQSPIVRKFMEFISIKQNFVVPGIILAILILIVWKKRGLAFLVSGAIVIGLNDFISHQILKEIFARPRPCHTLAGLDHISNCSNSFSFPSNHASNLFTFATLMTLCFRNTVFLVYTMALLVGYSRVYLGVHYPTDVLGGAVCGIVMGVLGYQYVYKRLLGYLKAGPAALKTGHPEPKVSTVE